MLKDVYYDARSTVTLKPQSIASSNANGTGVDLLGYEGCLMICHVGASGGTLGTANLVTIGFVASNDNSTFAAIADTDLIGGNNTVDIDNNTEGNSTHQRTYKGLARYVAINIVPTNAVTLPICAEIVRAKPIHAPIA